MLTLTDVFKAALFNEVSSRAFYTRAGAVTSSDEARLWFLELADLEEDHARELIDKAVSRALPLGFDATTYLEKLKSSTETLLSAAEERMIGKGDVGELLDHAKGMEVKARDDYLALAAGTEDPELTEYFRTLAGQEHRHYEEFCRIEQTLGLTPICHDDPS